MKRKITLAVLVVLALVLLNSCGMGWKQTVKNFKSDLGGGIDRVISVENTYTGATIKTYDGKAYINDDAKPGNFAITYWTNGSTKTDDYIEDTAFEKLGMIKGNWIIFKEQE